jgi:uncharacterized membrane protein
VSAAANSGITARHADRRDLRAGCRPGWAIGSVLFSRIGKTVSPAAMNLMKCLTAATCSCSRQRPCSPRSEAPPLGEKLSLRTALAIALTLAAAAGRVSIGAAALLVSALLFGRARAWTRELAADFAWIKLALASIVGTFARIWMAQIALAPSASTGVATPLLATSPIFALPLAQFIGHERVRARAALGAVIAVIGVALMTIPR